MFSFKPFVKSLFDFSKLKGVSFGLVLGLFHFFLLVNVNSLVTDNAGFFKDVLMIYMLGLGFFFAIVNQTSPLMKINFKFGFIKYAVTLILGMLFVSSLSFLNSSTHNSAYSFGFFALLYGVVVSFSEDTLFSAFLPTKLGRIPSALVFALFHSSVYASMSVSLSDWFLKLFIAFIAGLIFQLIISIKSLGLPVSSAFHTVFNLASIGLLTFASVGITHIPLISNLVGGL